MAPSYSNKRWTIISLFTIVGQMFVLNRLHLNENVGREAVETIQCVVLWGFHP